MPEIIWKGAHKNNFSVGRNGHRPVAICQHVAEGGLSSVASWFNNPQSQASTHYIVGKKGEIWQFVKDEDFAFANGVWEQPDPTILWLADAFRRSINPNNLTLSIEREGFKGEALTETQYQSLLWLTEHLCEKWRIPKDRQHIIGHYQISKTSRPNCPGPNHPWQRLMADLATQTPPPPPVLEIKSNGFIIRGEFAERYQREGGLRVFGYALTNQFVHPQTNRLMQVFEGYVMEIDPNANNEWRHTRAHAGAAWLELNRKLLTGPGGMGGSI